jgi:hypothetical protein
LFVSKIAGGGCFDATDNFPVYWLAPPSGGGNRRVPGSRDAQIY